MISPVPRSLPCDDSRFDSTNPFQRPSYRSPSLGTRHHRAVHSFHQFLICAYLVPILCSPYVSLVPDHLCLAVLSQIPFFPLPSSFAAEHDLGTVAHEATWLTRVPNSSPSQYYSSNYNLAINNLQVRVLNSQRFRFQLLVILPAPHWHRSLFVRSLASP